ncbi:MAG: hypothetical protein AKCLJLPJ_02544 [Fimbriimonadales bacterium]|nr:hypothetical protein [Armatimonadota bacterium]MBV6504408.1 hypothetical protein [Fimbriimonadales bacterium]NOG94110.1 hypothetical protein [Armatimonadota bacterium]
MLRPGASFFLVKEAGSTRGAPSAGLQLIRGYQRLASSHGGRCLAALFLLTLASNYSEAPIGGLVFGLLVLMAWVSDRVALMALFSATFLPYAWPFTLTVGFPLVFFVAAPLLLDLKRVAELPRVLVVGCFLLGGLILAGFAFTKSPDLLLLASGVVAMLAAAVFVRRSNLLPLTILYDFALVLVSVVVVPLIFNAFMLEGSPFRSERLLSQLFVGRVTVGVAEPNVIAAFLAVSSVIALLSARTHERQSLGVLLHGALAILFLYASSLVGSRIALVVAGAAILATGMASLGLAGTRGAIHWGSVRAAFLGIVFGFAGLATVTTAVTGAPPAAVSRLVSTTSFEDTGRPLSFRYALPLLDEVPLVGVNQEEYHLQVSPLSPHLSVVAAALYMGVLVTIATYVLLLIPALDIVIGRRLAPDPLLGIAVLLLLIATLAIPLTSDRSLLCVVGAWYGHSWLQRFREAAPPAVRAPSLSA